MKNLQNDGSTKVHRGTRNTQLNWFQQIHGSTDSVFVDYICND